MAGIINQKLSVITPTPPIVATGFTTEWQTTSSNETITLPLYNSGTFNATVDWGDGTPESTITSYTDANRIHEYAVAGTYRVDIKGECPGFVFQGGGDRLKIKKVLHWGESSEFGGFSFLTSMFSGCGNLTELPSGSMLIKSNPTTLGSMFFNCSSLLEIPSGIFDNISGVTTSNNASIFRGCSSLTTLPSGLFTSLAVGTTSISLDYLCNGCSSLTAIPVDLLSPFGTKLTGGGYCFTNCSSLTSIPETLFSSNTNMTSMLQQFQGCNSITSIPAGLFSATTKVNLFNSTFKSCSGINTPIPSGLFANILDVGNTGAWETFSGCLNITGAIPSGLFDNFTSNSNGYNATFKDCRKITSIPTDLFRYSTTVTGNRSFYQTFQNCYLLTSIPEDLFRYNTLVGGPTDTGGQCFYQTFQGCSAITSVPETLFSYNTDVRGFDYTLSYCGLASIPAGIFSANTEVTKFNYIFAGVQHTYTSIPATLFANNHKVLTMSSNFLAADITSIPETLFSSLTGCTLFDRNFNGCNGLSTIPAGLYSGCTSALAITNEYQGCQGLTSIPTDLFRYNVNVTNFTSVFNSCSNLVTVPNGVFKYNTGCTNFTGAFGSCHKFALTPYIFDDSGVSGSTRFLNQNVNFSNCFWDIAYTGLAGTAPELWGYDFGSGTPTTTGAFLYQTTLTNYADIPTAWGGA